MKTFFIFLIFLFNSFFILGQLNNDLHSNNILSADKLLVEGRLDNGFSYYIRSCDSLSKLVSIQLIVKAGYLQEDEDQMGVAHLLEHVVFKGTRKFPGGVFSYLEKYGMRRGSQINASTGYTYTGYRLTVPSDSIGAVDIGLNIVRDLCDNALLRPSDVEIERQAVLGEHLMTSGPEQRELDYIFPRIFGRSFYSERGIGTGSESVIKNIKAEELVSFYNDWYRPDLMSIIVVGDVNPKVIEKEVKDLFRSLSAPKRPRKHVDHKLYRPDKSGYYYFLDTDRRDVLVRIYSKFPGRNEKKTLDLKYNAISMLYNTMVKYRFSELQNQYFPPFGPITEHMFNRNGLLGLAGMDVLMTSMQVDSVKHIKRDVLSLMRELYRIEYYGFNDSEFVKAKEFLLEDLEGFPPPKSNQFSSQYIDYFLNGNIPLNPETKTDLMRSLFESISLSEVNNIAKEWLQNEHVDIVFSAPSGAEEELPHRDEWNDYMRVARSTVPEPYQSVVYKQYRPAIPLGDSSIKYTSRTDSVGFTEVKLPNGITIVMKPDRGQKAGAGEAIALHAFRSGGAAGYFLESDYLSAISAADIVGKSGISHLGHFDFDAYCQRNQIDVFPYIQDYKIGFKGRSERINGLTALLDVICQYFTAPRLDEDYFNYWKRTECQNLSYKIGSDFFYDSIRIATKEIRGILTPDAIHELRLNRTFEIFREQFQAANGFTFIITGSFDEETILPLVIRYLSSIPVSAEAKGRVCVERDVDSLSSSNNLTIYSSSGEGASVALRLSREIEFNSENVANLIAIKWILQRKLRERLRDREKGVYAVGSTISFFKCQKQRFVLGFNFECSADRVNSLVNAAIEEIRSFSEFDEASYLQNYIAEERQVQDKSRLNSAFWQESLFFSYFNGIEIKNSLFDKFSPKVLNLNSMRMFSSKYLASEIVKTYVMMPRTYQ